MHIQFDTKNNQVSFSAEYENAYEAWVIDYIGRKADIGSPLHYCGVIDDGKNFKGSKYSLKFNFNGTRIETGDEHSCAFANGVDVILQAVSEGAIRKLRELEKMSSQSNSCLKFARFNGGGLHYIVFDITCG